MTRFLALLVFGALAFGSALAEQSRPVLVELFASQNCPACPRAHQTMQQLSDTRGDILVLTWSVDYWDYLGDPDPMALPQAKARQSTYVEQLALRAPYTPQSIYDGAKQCPGTRRKQVEANIKARLEAQSEDCPDMVMTDRGLVVQGEGPRPLELTLVEFLSGEANQTNMVNPVTSVRSLGLWTGQNEPFPVSCAESCAALLHRPDQGEVLGVHRLH